MASGVATTTIDFGATPIGEKDFTITDANVSTASYVEAFIQHNDTTATNGTEMHKNAGVFMKLVCSAGTGQFLLHAGTLFGLVSNVFSIRYVWNT